MNYPFAPGAEIPSRPAKAPAPPPPASGHRSKVEEEPFSFSVEWKPRNPLGVPFTENWKNAGFQIPDSGALLIHDPSTEKVLRVYAPGAWLRIIPYYKEEEK